MTSILKYLKPCHTKLSKYNTIYYVYLDEFTKKTTIHVIEVFNKFDNNKEYDLTYNYIPRLNILELDTSNIDTRFIEMPRILHLEKYYDEEIQKFLYYFGYMIINKKNNMTDSCKNIFIKKKM